MRRRWLAVWVALCLLLSGCAARKSPSPAATGLRGVWVSYLDLIPLLTDADPTTAAEKLDRLMDICVEQGLNTVFLHVRSHGDAYYASSVYPVATSAENLVEQGFDPLAHAVKAAHQRGLHLHAWINPYRLNGPADHSFQKGDGWYLNPADEAARQRILSGVEEILARYEVDGIHFDDYFYPSGMAAQGEPFESIPDGADVTLWRQTQVDSLIGQTYRLCEQRGRQFGVSPMADLDKCRTDAYADVERWLSRAGYVHYVCPQLYTGFAHQTQPFDALLKRWSNLPRRDEVRLYIGLPLYKAGLADDSYAGSGNTEWAQNTDVIKRQILSLREVADGFVLFRYAHLFTRDGAAAWEQGRGIL